MQASFSHHRIALAVFTVLLTGCAGKYTGGGWIESTLDPDGKATFGFNMHAEDSDGDGLADDAKGQFQYSDLAAGVRFNGGTWGTFWAEIAPGDGDPETPDVGYFYGWYDPHPKMSGWDLGGFCAFYMMDFGEPGPSEGDWLEVIVADGIYAGYYNSGFLRGGNIQYHPPK